MHVVYSVDRSFAMPAAVSLRSLQESNQGSRISVTILTLDFDAGLESRLRRSVPDLDIRFLDVEQVVPHGLPRVSVFSRAAYGRLFAPQCLGPESSRILYLDADTIVLNRISPLFEQGLGEHAVGAVQSVSLPFISAADGLPYWKDSGVAHDAPYFNSGVLVIDCERWINERIAQRALHAAVDHQESILWPDQDALNVVLRGDFARLDSRWNVESPLRQPSNLGHALFDPTEIARAIDDPAIVHFNGSPKPWHRGCQDPARSIWWDYLARTEWTGLSPMRPLSLPRELKHRIGLALRG